MSEVLKLLVASHSAGRLSFERVAVFGTDEFVGLGMTHAASQHSYFWHHLFKHVDVRSDNVHVLDGNAVDLAKECAAYEDAILKAGGLKLVVAESGRGGEIGRNGPGSSLVARTRERLLDFESSVHIAEEQFDGQLEQVPKTCLTVGIGTVLQADEVVVVFSGIHTAQALENCVENPINHMWPVSMIQTKKRTLVICDEAATMELRVKTVKYFKGLQRTISELQQPSLLRPPPAS
ncbi:Glucosamine-6-phosphate isomerase 2 (Glucosamine-6-phosphate deaminase 2) (GNPDA 2) (GlcN6P deaminase 2) [Durusdinium trenchii]|uniref:glucosamine-6-phosphate deaminase n=1 Tax=Durusdinium trenchii TaxID=1381693 RepID=A0ABP0JJE5_9DINO